MVWTRFCLLLGCLTPSFSGYGASGSTVTSLSPRPSAAARLPETACVLPRPVLTTRGGARGRNGGAPEAVSWYQQAGDSDDGAASSEALRAVSIAPSIYKICMRAVNLAILFTPMIVTAPFAYPAFMAWFRVWLWYV